MRGKRIITLFMVLVMLVTILPVPVQAATGDKLIALTFDDGPNKQYTQQLLDGLKARGVNVTFFMIGSNAAANMDLVQRAYDEGHEVGNHTYSHPNLNTVGYDGVKNQLNSTAAVLDNACGSGTDYLVRPPYGNANATVLSAMNSPAINWSVDTNDWKYRNSDHVYNHIINNAYDGAIILCHDIYASTVTGALRAVDVLLARGYEFVTISELYRRRGVTLQDGVKYYDCKNNGVDYGPVEKPVISYEPADGGVRVTIDSPGGAPVYYTLNGSRFNQQSTLYTGSFVTSCPVEIQAVAAFKLNGDRSEVTTCNVTVPPCTTPVIQIKDGRATISCSTSGAPIYYTLDDTKATTSSRVYTGAFNIKPGTTVRAVAGGGNYLVSGETVLHYSKQGNLFTDVFPYNWHYDAVDELATRGIMKGVGNNTFASAVTTTRTMIVAMLYRYSGEQLEAGWTRTNTFTDVPDGVWYSDAVEWAYRNNLIDGYMDNTFRGSRAISRAEMCKIFVNFLNYKGHDLDVETDGRYRFKDGNTIPNYAAGCVNATYVTGLMIGDKNGNFVPSRTATRAEAAVVMMRMINLEEQLAEQKKEQELELPEEQSEGLLAEQMLENQTEQISEESTEEESVELSEKVVEEPAEEVPGDLPVEEVVEEPAEEVPGDLPVEEVVEDSVEESIE